MKNTGTSPIKQYLDNAKEITDNLKPIKSKFKLTGIGRKKSITCEPLDNENIFWPIVGITQDRFDAFWNYYVDRDKKEQFFVMIEHYGINDDGIPKLGTVVEIIIE